jgi:TolB-like protein/DNA-binding winged helix-turn-helix (wHTH) protein/tetratricopeptide (TPR) repeat protein
MDFSVNDPGDYVFGPFRLDPVRRVLLRDGQLVRLQPRLFEALYYMVRSSGRLVEKDELMAALWPGRIVEESNLSQTIFALRKALAPGEGDEAMIVTAPGRGFRLAVPVRIVLDGGQAYTHATMTAAAEAPAHHQPIHTARWLWAAGASAAALLVVCAAVLMRRVPPAAAGFDPPPHSVAVLAFTDMSGDPRQDYFGDGLAEELINALGRLPRVHVAARVSAFSFKTSTATVADIARRLNVGTVLEGSLRRDGAKVRVGVQLIDGRTGFQIWSRSYDRDLHDLLSMEGEIAGAVAASLQVSLVQGESERLTLGGTTNPDAFDAYLRGMLLLRSNDDGAIGRARDAFDFAIGHDPSYARAYAGRAYALCDLGMNPPPGTTAHDIAATFSAALAAADKAVALAPDLASAHAARGEVLDNGFLRTGEAAAEAARARDLEPGNAAMVGAYAQVQNDLGHADEAVAAARLATTLDPLRPDVWYVLSYVLYSARSFGESIAAAQHEKQLRGTLPEHSMEVIARNQLLLGEAAAAVQSCRAVSASDRDVCLAMANHALGNTGEAQASLARVLALPSDSAPYNLAEVYAQWRNIPAALAALATALRTHDPALTQIRADPLLDPIRKEPEFAAIERQLNLPP